MYKTVNPAMITLARESRGMSQTKLAKKLGITQAAISKIESGQISVDDKMLSALSKKLDYLESFFMKPFEVYPPSMSFYRKHKTMPAKSVHVIEAALNLFRIHVSDLLNAAEIDFEPIPYCDIDEFESARAIARSVREYLNIPRGAIDSVTEVLERMGIIVIPFDTQTRLFSGAKMAVNSENYIIMVNSRMPGDRLRYTLAHELAHIIIHRLPTETMETEADEFASEFLMPSDQIKPELANLSVHSLASLKRRWKVSMNAILTNAYHIKAISEWHHRQLRIELAENNITRLQEPPAFDIPIEEPTLLRELLDYHFEDLRYEIHELCEMLGLTVSEFADKFAVNPTEKQYKQKPRLTLVS